MDGMTDGSGQNNNVFLQSLQQLGQYLQQQNANTGSGLNLGSGAQPGGISAFGGQQPSKIVTQVHFQQPDSSTDQENAQPAVTSAPPAPQVASFAPPQGSAQGIAQPNAVNVPSPKATTPPQSGAGGGTGADPDPDSDYIEGAGSGAGKPSSGPGSGVPTSNAISGVTSAIAQGISDAGKAIGAVKTMPTPIQSGPFPGINQQAPTLIGRRTQPAY
jgi:hypothetical protein